MKLGLNIRNFGPAATPDNLRAWARFAEDTGFAVVMMSDHVAPTPDVQAIYPTPFYDPFTTLSWLAAQTRTLELGTSVTVLPYRNPLLTARVAANLDQFSGGRFILGVGVGWSKPEYDALGVPFERRGAITDEYLDVIRAFWANDRISADGRHVSFRDVSTAPRPVRTPPIWVGGTSPGAIRRAARYGDAWHPNNAGMSWLRDEGLPALRAAAEAAGRPVPEFSPRFQIQLTDHHVSADDRPVGTGTLAQIRADLDELATLGCAYVVLDTNPDAPDDPRPVTEDFGVLERVARSVT
ncbi:TIGR03619 family F420-dependent LLM class oxidoreductase [Micromonospora sp. NBC_01699]|uniref:TIGR03619 family F420-dependent LLM class oxidoreductase n=1 Tax=Micromonospora sp. NBC_01699 TaxID=2975984 RepID=UPI002E2DAF9A|nr:TIGR03619 family F420-dependent LLM class oxidoreductase [Micromonospora sp. NBC_01699]